MDRKELGCRTARSRPVLSIALNCDAGQVLAAISSADRSAEVPTSSRPAVVGKAGRDVAFDDGSDVPATFVQPTWRPVIELRSMYFAQRSTGSGTCNSASITLNPFISMTIQFPAAVGIRPFPDVARWPANSGALRCGRYGRSQGTRDGRRRRVCRPVPGDPSDSCG